MCLINKVSAEIQHGLLSFIQGENHFKLISEPLVGDKIKTPWWNDQFICVMLKCGAELCDVNLRW